jgi:charged multivesicular body protein 4
MAVATARVEPVAATAAAAAATSTITTAKSKQLALAAMREKEAGIAARIDDLVARGELQVDDEGNVSGCGRVCRLFFGPRRRAAPRSEGAPARQQTGVEAAVFGKRGKVLSANARLDQAAESVEAHAAQLSERASAARERAKALAANGKRTEAMMALKRAKGLEKQAENAAATHAAIEAQKDLLDGQELQREIASALAASVATTKSKTKGLLTKTETAVDSMEEMRDAFEEVGQVLGGLQSGADVDDEELAAELDQMIALEVPEAATEPAAAAEETAAAAAAAAAAADLKAAAEIQAAFPAAPRKGKEEKLGLLGHDSAKAA